MARAAAHFQGFLQFRKALLAEWTWAQGALGLPPSHVTIRYCVVQILAEGRDTRPLGKHLIGVVFKRNRLKKTLRGKRIQPFKLARQKSQIQRL